jgi:hypothetical protein
MRLHYDEKADARNLRLDDSKIEESQEVQPLPAVDWGYSARASGRF